MPLSPELLPQCFEDGAIKAADAMRQVDNVLVAGHVNPDGDALGAMAAAGAILDGLGRNFVIYTPTGIPAHLRFLAMPGPVCASFAELPFAPEAAVYVDCSEPSRLGPKLEAVWDAWPTINIDHHICEKGMGSLANYIDVSAAATCQLMAYVALKLGMPLAGNLAEAIGLGIMTDTGQFSHANTSPAVFVLAAALEVGGLSIPALGEKLRSGLSLNRLNLWGRLFQRIRLGLDGKAAYCPLFLADLEATGCRADEAEGFVDWLRNINDVRVGLFAREIEPGITKFSMRSLGEVNVQQMAAKVGGGGHRNAAGGTLAMPPDRAIEVLLGIIAEMLAA